MVTGPLFPFGHGLSYTEFTYSNLEISPTRTGAASTVKVTCDVTNTGARAGEDVVQLYLRDDYASVTTFDMVLREFARVSLEPGQTKQATVMIGASSAGRFVVTRPDGTAPEEPPVRESRVDPVWGASEKGACRPQLSQPLRVWTKPPDASASRWTPPAPRWPVFTCPRVAGLGCPPMAYPAPMKPLLCFLILAATPVTVVAAPKEAPAASAAVEGKANKTKAPKSKAKKAGAVSDAAPNLLFIMTDQQRWDALSYSGNKNISTPNIDRLAREGAYFANAYSGSPVCVPARAVILTGASIETVRIRQNQDYKDPTAGADLPTFDNILSKQGYYSEYWGKWHVPMKYGATYSLPVRPINTHEIPGVPSETEAFRTYLKTRGLVGKAPGPGEALDEYGRVYKPVPLDTAAGSQTEPSQTEYYGVARTGPDATLTAFTGDETITALERAHKAGKPFSITASFGPPHPPLIVPEPYYSKFPADKLPVPASIDDPMTDSPYRRRAHEPETMRRFRNPGNVRQMKQIYYGMVAEVDEWVGRIMKRLTDLGLDKNTLVVFTSDHGEMLGDHGMHSKMIFLEGSAHIPLILWMPGRIPAGKKVAEPVGHLDLMPTILDYLGAPAQKCDGQSLRGLVEGRAGRGFAISEWEAKKGPTLMLRDAKHKLITSHQENGPDTDALYDLSTDPDEMNNLIGTKAKDREAGLKTARALKAKLETWLETIKSPRLEGLKKNELR
jgi:arylsulfatase A-like enzyme